MFAMFPLSEYLVQVSMHQNVTIMGSTECGTSEYVSLTFTFLNKTYLKSSLLINMAVRAYKCPGAAVAEWPLMKTFTILKVTRTQSPPASVEQKMSYTICLSGSLFSETVCTDRYNIHDGELKLVHM